MNTEEVSGRIVQTLIHNLLDGYSESYIFIFKQLKVHHTNRNFSTSIRPLFSNSSAIYLACLQVISYD